jgi:hypothetical protein
MDIHLRHSPPPAESWCASLVHSTDSRRFHPTAVVHLPKSIVQRASVSPLYLVATWKSSAQAGREKARKPQNCYSHARNWRLLPMMSNLDVLDSNTIRLGWGLFAGTRRKTLHRTIHNIEDQEHGNRIHTLVADCSADAQRVGAHFGLAR